MKIVADLSLTSRPHHPGRDAKSLLFGSQAAGVWVDASAPGAAFADIAGTTAPAFGASVALVDDGGPLLLHAQQPSAALRPLLGRAPQDAAPGGAIDQGTGPAFLRFDLTDDKLLHGFAQGFAGDVMLFGRAGSWIDPGVTAAGTLEIGPDGVTGGVQGALGAAGDIVGWVALDRSLSPGERSMLLRHFRARGARGLLTPGPELLANGDFAAGDAGWDLGAGWSVSGGLATHAPPTGSDVVQYGVLGPHRLYIASFEIAAIRTASLVYIRPGIFSYTQVGGNMTAGTRKVIFRTGGDVSAGFGVRAGGPSDVDFATISLCELRPEEDW